MTEKLTRNYEWFKKPYLFGEGAQQALSEPIIVNERFEIIEGLARFEERKRRDMPIKYIIIAGFGRKESITYAEAFRIKSRR